jgi:pimeloyl-ACP methyl ester carboxylesterase
LKAPSYWKDHYVIESSAEEIGQNLKVSTFPSGGQNLELIHFEVSKAAPNILISQGSGGHAFVFGELGYFVHKRGYNVFIMPKHGGRTINDLVVRHVDALRYISSSFTERIGVFSEGLGGLVSFYVALRHGAFKSAIYQNAPALLTEQAFSDAVIRGQRKALLPIFKLLLTLFPGIKVPISSYLNWRDLIDSKEGNRQVEKRLVAGYLGDPDFDRWYPVEAVMSLLRTPPPRPLAELNIPTMFMVSQRGVGGTPYVKYLEALYDRLPVRKKMTKIDGSAYWMLSHPTEAAEIICEWFVETL